MGRVSVGLASPEVTVCGQARVGVSPSPTRARFTLWALGQGAGV